MEKTKLLSLCVGPDATIKEAIQRLNETGLKILFVTDIDQRLLGTLSDGDIRRGITSGAPLTTPVSQVMATNYHALDVGSDDLAKKAVGLMQRHLIEHVPILDSSRRVQDVLLWVDFLGEDVTPTKQRVPDVDFTVVIMAGGKGTRLDPFTKVLPKPLIPIGEKPIIEIIMDRFYDNGFSKFVIIVNYRKEMIKAFFSDRSLPYSISFVDEDEFFGTAGGLYLLRSTLKHPFILTNCDTVLEGSYQEFCSWHTEQKNTITIVGAHKEFTVPYGVLCMSNGILERIDEKPKLDIFINTGTYVFDHSVFDFIEDRQHLDMDRLIRIMQSELPDRLGVFPHWGGWFDIGQWEEYRKSLKDLSHA